MTSILRAASAGCYLVAYPILSIHSISVGWMSSHGYDFVERDKDRNYVLSHALQDEDKQVSDPMLRVWWSLVYCVRPTSDTLC